MEKKEKEEKREGISEKLSRELVKELKKALEASEEGLSEGWAHDPISTVFGGLVLTLLGFCFLWASWLEAWGKWWAFFLVGLGFIFFIEVLLRSVFPAYRRPVSGRLIAGAVLIIIGTVRIIGFPIMWPLILVAIGLVIAIYGLLRAISSKL